MSLVVQKFGGTSVGDAERIRQVADHVARTVRRGNQVVLVVSAMGKETDELLRLADDVARGLPPLGIGDDSIIAGAIIDKNVRIGRRVRIVNEHGWVDTADDDRFTIRDGVAVVPHDAPNAHVFEPNPAEDTKPATERQYLL